MAKGLTIEEARIPRPAAAASPPRRWRGARRGARRRLRAQARERRARNVAAPAQVAKHDTEEDCYIIIGNTKNGGPKVYNVTPYLDDHPGGSEVILELAGKYADDMFEDIGHSQEARTQLKEFLVGPLEATEEEIAALSSAGGSGGGDSMGLVIGVLVAVVAVGVGAYFYTMQ